MTNALSVRKLLTGFIAVLVVAIAYSAWLAWRTESELRSADAAVDRLQDAVAARDDAERDAAVNDLRDAASSAADRTDGPWWFAMTKLPLYGDDAAGLEALSASIDIVASDAIAPLVETVDALEGVVVDGRIDVDAIAALDAPVTSAAAAMRRASALVKAEDSSAFVSALRTRYDDYVRRIAAVADDFGSATKAVDVLPGVLGASGPRDYLLLFHNNAEIRSLGGIPGSWARLHVEDGRISLREQGSATDFNTGKPVQGLTAEESAVYDLLPALYFQNPGFIPDVPRAAQLYDEFWERKFPETPLDGVMSLDVVAMSYLMQGTGPISAGQLVLTSENLINELLSRTYQRVPDPVDQDIEFQRIARAVLTAVTEGLDSPVDLVRGFVRAVEERRASYTPFTTPEAETLQGARILGESTVDNGDSPHVDIGVNDATGGKMSFYLRYSAKVKATSCLDGRQELEGVMTLSQTISPAEAKKLPDYVTANDLYGIPAGSQLVLLRMYGPHNGAISDVRIDGKAVNPRSGLSIKGRPVVTVGPLIESTKDVIVTWKMVTGENQTAGGVTTVTPSIVAGTQDSLFESAC